MELYTVLTADVIASRHQETVVTAKKAQLRELTDAALVTPFTFSRGDEIQAVLAGVLSSPALLRKLRYHCLPLQLRIGIGFGRITSGLGAVSSWEMNGPAFHRARQALDELKQHRHWRTRLISGDPGLDQMVNTLLNLYDVIQSRWTLSPMGRGHALRSNRFLPRSRPTTRGRLPKCGETLPGRPLVGFTRSGSGLSADPNPIHRS